MKVGNTIGGLEVTDVKRVNKLNLIQFLKEVDSYLQQGYSIDVNSARQVGLVLMADVFKTEAASSVKVGSVGEKTPAEDDTSKEAEPVPEETAQQDQVTDQAVVEPAVDTVKEEAPIKTTTRSKKTVQ